ncbi:SSL2 DNA or RNA helicases of superfamily II [Acidimicrobiia bacterium]
MAGIEQETRLLRKKLADRYEFGIEDETYAAPSRKVAPRRLQLNRSELRPQLFDYQAELASSATELLLNGERGLLALPTGAGKTRTAVVAAFQFLVERGTSVGWLSPTRELVNQAFETATSLWSQFGTLESIDLVEGATPSVRDGVPTIWFTTPQAIYANRSSLVVNRKCDAVVFDEAHQLGAPTFREAVEDLVGDSGTVGLLGLSATPGRYSELETEELVRLFDRTLLHSQLLKPNPVEVLQRWGVLSRLTFRQIPGSIAPSEESRIPQVVDLCIKLAERNRRTLVFSGSVAGAIVTAEALRSRGVESQAVYSELGTEERDSRIAKFGSGISSVLVNQRLLATGYDCPAVSDVVLASRVGSPVLFEQMVGRAARGPKTGGGSKATVWQFEDHLALHGLPQSYYRYRDFDWV